MTADWHVDRKIGGISRYDEILEFRRLFGVECERRSVDLIVHAGDWADPGRDELENQVRIAECCAWMSCRARYGLVTIPGNHDVVLGTTRRTTLSPLARRTIYGTTFGVGHTQVREHPETVNHGADQILILAVPYPHDTRDFARPYGESDYHEALKSYTDRVSDYSTVVLISHLMLGEVEVELGEESGEMSRGDECLLPGYAIEAADLILQGHYHRRQRLWAVSGDARCEVLIPGSPIRHTFGERDDPDKGWWFVDV